MQQVASRLHFARPSQVSWFDAKAVEGVPSRDEGVVGDDGAELERKDVERSLQVNAVVTMFDSGGSSGQLRDELGVLPPGDILKCALALSRNTREARRVLLARLPTLEHARLGGHTGGNLLLSMMQSYSGDFLNAVDGRRALLGCRGRVWPVTVESAQLCAESGDGSLPRGEVDVEAGQSSGRLVKKVWLEPPVSIHPVVAKAIAEFDAVIIGPGSFYTSLMPNFLVRGVPEALAGVKGP